MYLQTPEVLIPALGICAAMLIFAIVKKAAKLCTFIIILGVALAAVRPTVTQVMIDNGVAVKGTVLTVTTEQEKFEFDLALGAEFSSTELPDGSYVINVTIPEVGEKTIEVSASTAQWIDFGIQFIVELEKAGENVVLRDWRI